MLVVDRDIYGLKESQFTVTDAEEHDDGSLNGVTIHPWDRDAYHGGRDRGVYINTGFFRDHEGRPFNSDNDAETEYAWNFIADREEFVTGLLAVFPELKRA